MGDVDTIIIDNGSEMCKAGIAGDYAPKFDFPNVACYPKSIIRTGLLPGISPSWRISMIYYGNKAQANRHRLNLKHPIEKGCITDWDTMESIWDFTFSNVLEMPAYEHPVLLTDAPLSPKINREKMAQIMLETFSVPAFFVIDQAVLSLYSSGRATGLVVNSGGGVTNIVPIYEGYALPYAIQSINVTGRDLTLNLARLMTERGHSMELSAENETAKGIKEKDCYVALDFQEEMRKDSVEMPDGSTVALRSERFTVPEALFQPCLLGLHDDGIGEAAYKSIIKCETDIRNDLYYNIIMSGGSTMFQGIAERLNKELVKRAPPSMKIKIVAPPERKHSTWIGGSILTSLSSFQKKWITKAEYDEVGGSIIRQRCF